MRRIQAIARGTLAVALGMALTACAGAPAASSVADAAPTTVASASPVLPSAPSPSIDAAPSATDSALPSTSAKPRPSIDQTELGAMLTSSITLLNLADADLAVVVAWVDPDSDAATDLGTYALGFTEQQTSQVPPGVYRLEFGGGTGAATCTLELGDGDAYTFAAIDDAVAVSRAGDAPTDVRQLFVATSSLCGK